MICCAERCEGKFSYRILKHFNVNRWEMRMEKSQNNAKKVIEKLQKEAEADRVASILTKTKIQQNLIDKVSRNGKDFLHRMNRDIHAKEKKIEQQQATKREKEEDRSAFLLERTKYQQHLIDRVSKDGKGFLNRMKSDIHAKEESATKEKNTLEINKRGKTLGRRKKGKVASKGRGGMRGGERSTAVAAAKSHKKRAKNKTEDAHGSADAPASSPKTQIDATANDETMRAKFEELLL